MHIHYIHQEQSTTKVHKPHENAPPSSAQSSTVNRSAGPRMGLIVIFNGISIFYYRAAYC